MTDSTTFELDMRAFCAEVMREYEEVIETIIERSAHAAPPNEDGSGTRAFGASGPRSSERVSRMAERSTAQLR